MHRRVHERQRRPDVVAAEELTWCSTVQRLSDNPRSQRGMQLPDALDVELDAVLSN